MFSLVHALSSPTSAEYPSSLFGWFTGTMAQSDFPRAYTSILRPSPSWTGPDQTTQTPRRTSRFSCMLFLRVRGVLDYAGPQGCSRLTQPTVLPSTYGRASASWNRDFSRLNSPAH